MYGNAEKSKFIATDGIRRRIQESSTLQNVESYNYSYMDDNLNKSGRFEVKELKEHPQSKT